MSRVAVIIEWPDGTRDKGPTPDDVLELIASTQWSPVSPERMRDLLSDRAWAWSESAVDPQLPLQQFFEALAAAQMLRIVEWEPENGSP